MPCCDAADPAVRARRARAAGTARRSAPASSSRSASTPCALSSPTQQQPVVGAPLRAVEERRAAGGQRRLARRPHGRDGARDRRVGHRHALVVAAAAVGVPAVVAARLQQVHLVVPVRAVLDGEHLPGARADGQPLHVAVPQGPDLTLAGGRVDAQHLAAQRPGSCGRSRRPLSPVPTSRRRRARTAAGSRRAGRSAR